jgi:hypothetical protein
VLNLQHIVWVSLAYLAAYFLTFTVVMPLQTRYVSGIADGLSLLFLPHGVRVLATWLLGWRSVLAIMPANVFVYFVLYAGHPDVSWPEIIIGILFTATIVPLTFEVMTRLGIADLYARGGPPRVRPVMLAGIVASIPNAAFLSAILSGNAYSFIGVIIGDVMGMIVLLLALLYVFRFYLDRTDR